WVWARWWRSGSEAEEETMLLKDPEWGMLIVFYFFLGGIAGGAYFTAAIADNFGEARDRRVMQTGYLLSVPLIALCGVLLILDLGVPSRFMNMLGRFKFWDPMSIGAWALGAFGAIAFVSALMSFSDAQAALRRKLGLVGIVFGFFVAAYTGVLLSNSALPQWEGGRLMGALFLASGASTGMAAISLILFLTGAGAGEGWAKVKRADRFSIIIELVTLALFLWVLGSAAGPLLSGKLAGLFWGGLVVVGLLVPLAIELAGPKARAVAALSAVLVLVGGFVLRYVLLMAIHA
ncbi:MAG TPA: NrfD/PsrC family molybdoenzyme membrane anchor subunit, partial [Solirubrobacterales bacterium]|nr:NrfD/PsrC family molybdoenzyme membrane anchor subunit [Solirubrobacterales bacterium]